MLANIGDFLFRFRNLLFPLCLPLAFLPGPRLLDDALVAAALGFAASAVGELVRASTIGLQYIVRGGRDRRVYAKDLVTGGLYSHTRNPMYVGNMLILAGVVLASNSWTAAVTGIVLGSITYAAIIAAEEDFLRGKFGPGFDEYCRAVPRFWPRLAGLGETFGDSTFRWRRLVVKEYSTPMGWISTLCVIACWHLYREGGGFAGDEAALRCIGWIFGVAAVLWLTAWALKKRRIMVAD
jgi:hypothetical protein